MSTVARVSEISAMSETSFEDAIKVGIERAATTLRNLQSAWIKEQEVVIGEGGAITGYKVNMLVTFVLE
jgi:flavin-binding protein dodecin